MKFGELETTQLLGKGGMSEVWEAASPRLGLRRAVKLFAYPKDDADVRRRFEQEGRLLAKLDHPRVVHVSDLGTTDDGRPYFVMDLVVDAEGKPRSLADAVERGADEETIGRWYDDIREGLDYIHAKGIVHRDLKLQNVLIGPDGHAVLTDFGISRVSEPAGGGATVVDTVQTLVSIRDGRQALMGSVGYMAPELELGVAASPQSDWYALGVIVYRLLTGTWCDARTDVRTMLESYNPAWLEIVPKLLHANPAARECPPYAATCAALQERRQMKLEERLEQARKRGRAARHWVRGLLIGLLVLGGGLGTGLGVVSVENRTLRTRLHQLEAQPDRPSAAQPSSPAVGQPSVITFDSLFLIPSEARAEAQEDARGNVVMPSREDFALARDDAFILTRSLMGGLQTGKVTLEGAITQLERWQEQLDEDSERSPFDSVDFGGSSYVPSGENQPLQMLIEGAIERLKTRAAE